MQQLIGRILEWPPSLTWALKSAQAIEAGAVVWKQQQQSVPGDMVTAERRGALN